LAFLKTRKELVGIKFVTPGIRLPNAPADDQNRTLPPREAARKGADFQVIGRPITGSESPEKTAQLIASEIEEGLKERFHLSLFGLQKIKFGAFRLKLHDTNPEAPLSPIYLDIRKLPEDVYELAGDVLHDLVSREGLEFDYVIGIPKAGEPIGMALAKAVGKPHLRMEKIEGEGGRHIGSNILDPFVKGKRVLLVDDLVTRAHTKLEAIASIEQNGLEVVGTVVLYDREQGGLSELNAQGKRAFAVSKLSDALAFFVLEKKITSEMREQVMAYIRSS
jgi:orotate phosphoribosyltransferase